MTLPDTAPGIVPGSVGCAVPRTVPGAVPGTVPMGPAKRIVKSRNARMQVSMHVHGCLCACIRLSHAMPLSGKQVIAVGAAKETGSGG